jgi:hypothetical protein
MIYPNNAVFTRPASLLPADDHGNKQEEFEALDGIDVRTYIATAALQGLLANSSRNATCEVDARIAVQAADALIAELNK